MAVKTYMNQKQRIPLKSWRMYGLTVGSHAVPLVTNTSPYSDTLTPVGSPVTEPFMMIAYVGSVAVIRKLRHTVRD